MIQALHQLRYRQVQIYRYQPLTGLLLWQEQALKHASFALQAPSEQALLPPDPQLPTQLHWTYQTPGGHRPK